MRTVQLFVSSPGDVELERARVDRVTERLNGEFWPRVHFQTLRWETKYYSAHKSFQEHIADAATCDVVIGTFWSRLGTELPAHVSDKYRMADGRPYPSGSAYEVLTAIEARKSADRPDVYVFRKTAPAMVALNDPAARAEADRQWERLEDFFARWFRAPDGTFLKAYHEFKTTDQFEDAVEKLLRIWLDEKALAGRTITWPIETKGSPFRGLAPFDAKHAPVFFGRSRKVMRAVDHLKSAARLSLDAAGRESADPATRQLKPFLLIVGPSGSGKSSLMRAGVGPRITAAGVVPEVDHWRIAVMRPGDDANAFEALARALMVTGKGDDPGGFGCALPEICGSGVTVAALAGQFESAIPSATVAVVAALDRVAAALREKQGFDRSVGVNLLLMVDQLEDIFAASVTDEQRTAFAGLLSALGATKRIWIVSTLRGDLYNRLLKNRALIALKDAGQTYDLAPPGAEEVAEIIQQSAEAAGLTYETDPQSGERLDDRLIADAEGKDVLPLLQFTLDRLFADRRVEGDAIYLTFASYRAMGGLDGAIDQVAESAIGKLGGAEIAALPRLLRSLAVTVREETGAAGELTVRAVPASDVIRNQATRGLADALIKARILLTSGAGEDGAGDESGLLRVAHQRVFESWGKARAILDEDRDYFRIRDVVEDQRERWQSSGQSRDLLVASGLPLEQAKSLVNRYGDELPPETHIFVRQSVARANRTRNIKRALQAGLAVFAVVATLAGVAARHYGNRAVANYESARQTVDDLVRSITERLRDTDRINVATVEDALNAVRPLVDKLETSSGGDPELKRTRAAMHYEFARTFQSADDHARALKEANESLALREGLLQLRPGDTEWEWDYSLSLDLVGDTERILRNHDRAGERYESALRIRDELIRRSPDTAKYLYGKSQSLIRSGDLTLELSDQARRIPRDQANEAARLAYEAALDLGVAVLRREPDNELYQRELSWGFQKIGVIRARMAHHADALDAQENALCVRRYLSSRNDRNTLRRRDVAFSLERVGDARQRLNDLPRATDALFEALTIRRALSGGDPNHGLWGRELTATLKRLGNLKRDMKDGELAAGYYLLAIQVANVILERAPETRFLLRERDDSKAAYDAAIGQLRAAPSALVPHDAALREAAEREESMHTRALAAPRGNVLACWDDLQMKLGLPAKPPRTASAR